MPRSRQGSREVDQHWWATGDPVTLDCSCGKRLGLLEVRADLEPVRLVGTYFHGRVDGGILLEGGDATTERLIICPRCGTPWRGRVGHLMGLVRGAQARGANRATLEPVPAT
jgi:hypothetical protein